ncbi:MAG: TlpA disulfide reductase family protein [Candidatus Sedimenticola endophacoides]
MKIAKVWIAILGAVSALSVAQAEPVDFSLPTLDGKLVKLSDYRGKWVVVNYWATWCPPCVAEMPELDAFHREHKDQDAVVVGVNLERIGLERLNEFVEMQEVSYPIMHSASSFKTALGRVKVMPTTYIVSPQGELVAREEGMVDKEMLEGFLNRQQ